MNYNTFAFLQNIHIISPLEYNQYFSVLTGLRCHGETLPGVLNLFKYVSMENN